MDLVANVIASKVEVEYVLESERKRALLAQCGVAEEDLSKVRISLLAKCPCLATCVCIEPNDDHLLG
jgi:hypothetical protein